MALLGAYRYNELPFNILTMVQVRNEKARRFLMNMRKKPRVNFEKYFVKADRGALRLLQRMLAFDPVERPTCEEALADPYFNGLSQPGREPSAQPVSKLSFEFERRKLTTDEVGSITAFANFGGMKPNVQV